MPSKIVNENDLRVKRTKLHITNALTALLETNSIDKISVAMICDEAMVNRATFYKHYDDKYQLLKQVVYALKETLIGDVIKSNITDYRQKYSFLLDNMITNMHTRRQLIVSLLKNSHNREIHGIFMGAIKEAIIDLVVNDRDLNIQVPSDLFAEFYSGGVSALLLSWILENKYTEKQIKQIIMHIVMQIYK